MNKEKFILYPVKWRVLLRTTYFIGYTILMLVAMYYLQQWFPGLLVLLFAWLAVNAAFDFTKYGLFIKIESDILTIKNRLSDPITMRRDDIKEINHRNSTGIQFLLVDFTDEVSKYRTENKLKNPCSASVPYENICSGKKMYDILIDWFENKSISSKLKKHLTFYCNR